MNLRAFVLAVGITAVGACTQAPAAPGTIAGVLPLCYGPGPDLNLLPTAEVKVYLRDHLVATKTFRADMQHRKYTFTLPPGSYELELPSVRQVITASVRSGSVTKADFRQLNCL